MLEISLIVALAMSITPFLSDRLNIPRKLRGWATILIVVILNVANSLVFGDQQIIEAIRIGIEGGAVSVGIYSTGKNTLQHVLVKDNFDKKN